MTEGTGQVDQHLVTGVEQIKEKVVLFKTKIFEVV